MNQRPRPTLSIITVVFNDASGFKDTLQSIQSQDFQDWEWIVIDGGSTDGTVAVIKENESCISHWVSEPDNGIYDAMNKGIQQAEGEWITFMNAGDSYKSASSLTCIFSHTDLSSYCFIYADMFLLDSQGHPVRKIPAERLTKWSITKGMIACHQCMFVRRSCCPMYDLSFKYQGDLNWTMTILFTLSESKLLHIPQDIVFFKSGGFSSQSLTKQLKAHLTLIKERYGIWMIVFRIPRLIRRYVGKLIRGWLGIDTFRFWSKSFKS